MRIKPCFYFFALRHAVGSEPYRADGCVRLWLYFFMSASEKLTAVFVHVLGRGGVVQATRQSLVRSFLVCACACACRVEPCCHVYIYIYIGDLDAIKRLLGAGANVKHTDWYGATNNYLYI
jgi:hypothetical protein